MDALRIFELQDPEKLRKSYLEFISSFELNMCRYAAYKSEIFDSFPTNVCGRTYNEIEDSCVNSWNRYKQLTWRAYRSIDQLAQTDDAKHLQLDLKLVGVRHFDRLNRIFHYLVFSYEPADITDDGIQSAAGALYGGIDGYDNLQKAVREWVRKHVLNTFSVGIAWLTQMYIYLLDMFREKVKNYLLAPGRYNHLAKHTIFLNGIDLEYHKIVRPWIRKAVRAIRDTCDSMSEYAHHDITARLKKIVFSIPTSIEHKLFDQPLNNIFIQTEDDKKLNKYTPATISDLFKSIPAQKILDHIYGSESYLTQNRNPQTLNHHVSGRNIIMELYRAKCGFIIYSALSQFNSNVVIRIQTYSSMKTLHTSVDHLSLHSKLDRMPLDQISHMANVDRNATLLELEDLENELGRIVVTQKLVNNAINAMSSSQLMSSMNERSQQQDHESARESGRRHVEYLREKRNYAKTAAQNEQPGYRRLSASNDNTNSLDMDENALMTETDETRARFLLLRLLQRHDEEDLGLGLESKDSLKQDELDPSSLAHAYIDNEALDYNAATTKAAAALATIRPNP
ncbi:unnamed protein product [Rotaria socialis]|uniref:Uncharacterized protein n=2 Tax=Rotaria socialis TaxID=392032 RepID=A0A820VQ29_9BILA|nr:unnamed protein product [Rotaria socialis]